MWKSCSESYMIYSIVLTLVLNLLLCTTNASEINIGHKTAIPTYFIDPHILGILEPRVRCLRGGSAASELKLLEQESATDYYRSHELLAYSFFVEDALINPHYRPSAVEAELEFIPILPLSWNANRYGHCSFIALIRQMMRVQDYIVKRDHAAQKIKPRFSVASTYNFRTQLGTGEFLFSLFHSHSS